jgi:hypothetical protein
MLQELLRPPANTGKAIFVHPMVDDKPPFKYYLSGLIGLLVVEMAANWVYYRYLNAHGRNTAAVVFLFVGGCDLRTTRLSLLIFS